MAADKVGVEQQKLEARGSSAAFPDSSLHLKMLHIPANCASKVGPPAAAGSAPSPSVVVMAKSAPPAVGAKGVLGQVASINQVSTSGKAVMISVPRPAAPQTLAVSSQSANIQIPPGMLLIRSESGQLMLVSRQALSQQGSAPMPRITAQQVTAAATHKSSEKVTVLRMALPTPAAAQKRVVKVIGVAPKAGGQHVTAVSSGGGQPSHQTTATEAAAAAAEPAATFSPETLESVKKCKNFLVTLIKLASSDPQAASMAANVRGLVGALLEGKVEAEQFTEQLYQELKSTPQPCLVPFLKKSLPAVRHLTADPELFIQQALPPPTASRKQSNTAKSISTSQQHMTDFGAVSRSSNEKLFYRLELKYCPGVAVNLRPALSLLRNSTAKTSRDDGKAPVAQSGNQLQGSFPVKTLSSQDPPLVTAHAFKDYREEDDINDVASMAGVNLREENAQILTSVVGSVVQSCQDQLFLSPNLLLSWVLHAGRPLGVTDVAPDVVALISHATQECLHGLIVKLSVMAGHRKAALKEDLWHTKVSDVRSQIRFLEEVETLKKRRNDEEERERLLRLARSRSHSQDPQLQQLKQRAKELQQMEEAQLQHREANLTALAAIGPRKKRVLEPESQVAMLPGPPRTTRITLRDLLLCMEVEPFLCHSLLLYRAML